MILTLKDSGITSLKDLKGKKFGFTEKSSSSGYRYPLLIFRNAGIEPNLHFANIYFMGSHPKVTDAISAGSIDSGATWDGNYIAAVKKHGDIFRIIEQTEPIPLDLIAASHTLDKKMLKELEALLLSLKPGDPEVNTEGFPYKGFIKKDDAFYNIVRDVMKVK